MIVDLKSKRMLKGTTTMEVGSDGVAVITIDHPPVNALSADGIVLSFNLAFFRIYCYF